MLTAELDTDKKVVGLNQTKKAIISGKAEKIFIAGDADEIFAAKIKKLCDGCSVPVDESFSMKELGEACKIDVGCAVCTLLKE